MISGKLVQELVKDYKKMNEDYYTVGFSGKLWIIVFLLDMKYF